jgi:PAS domain S-box-containing protein
MRRTTRTILWHYGGAVAFTAVAVFLRGLLDPWLGNHLPLATLYGAVALAVWVGGYRPALLAAALGFLACDWLFVEPRGAFGFYTPRNLIGLGAYLLSCGIIIGFGEALRAARRRAEASREEVQALLGILPVGVWWSDKDGWRALGNKASYEILRPPAAAGAALPAEREPLAGVKCVVDGRELSPDELPTQRAARTGRVVRNFEHDVVLDDGRVRTVVWNVAPLLDGGRQVRGVVGMFADVTDRKRAEEALRRTTEQLRIVTESMAAPVTRCSRDLRYLWVSKPYADWIGRPAHEIVGRPIRDVIGPEAFGQLRPYFERVLAGEVVRYEERVPFRGIGPRWITAVYTPTRDAQGACDGWVAVVNDIDPRKRMEEALRESEQRFHALADSVPAHVWMDDEGGRGAFANARFLEYAGLAPDRSAKGWPDVLHPDDKERYRAEYLSAAAAVRAFRAEVRLRRHDGTYRWFEVSGHPRLEDERFVGYVGLNLDVTDRKQTEGRLKASEQRLAEELEAMIRLHALNTRLLAADDLRTALDDLLESAVATSGADFGNVQLYNPLTEALEIVAQRGFRQDFLDYFRLVRVDEVSCCAQAMESGERIVIEDVALDPAYEPHRAAAAAAGYRAVQSTPLKGRDGSTLGMLSTHFRRPQRLSERNQRLLDVYARHAADLILRFRYEQVLKEADRRKDEFLATLAHELRNPLAPIRNAVEVLKVTGPTGPDLAWGRDVIERQAGQMARLLDDLLDVSRITRGRLELRKGRVTLAAAVESAVETSRPAIDGGGHRLTVTLPPEPVHLDADPVRLAQVFANLLNNAAKYTDRGGDVRLSAERAGQEVVVSVRDTGIGIAPEVLPRLFEMFSQAKPALERSQGGLGIGLSLVRGLAEMHGGRVEARSAGPGRGSEFVVRLPVAAAPEGHEQRPAEAEKPRATGLRVVVADDNRDAADTLAMMVRLMGHEVRIARDGQEAVEAAEAFRPDVVLLDIGMPRLNGYDAARRLRDRPWGRDLLLVAVTGWGQEEDRRRSKEAGFEHHLVKPASPAALEKLLGSVVPLKAE